MVAWSDFPLSQFLRLPYPSKSFSEQTIIVTGSNTGLGLQAAQHFVRLEAARVILAVRSLKKGEEAKAVIEAATGRNAVVEVWQLDMSSYDSIKEFVKRANTLERLDVVVENAGIAKRIWEGAEGTELTVVVNVIGTFLLALNLLPILRRSGEKTGVLPRLVITSSEVHAWTELAEKREDSIFEALKKNDPEYMERRYNTSKLLEVFVVRELAAAMENGPHASQQVILNTINPGLCHSELTRDVKGIQAAIFYLVKLVLARSTEVGGRTLVYGAIAGKESHGQYMSDCVVREPSVFVRSEVGAKTQKRAWAELKDILEGIQPGILKNI